MSGGPVVISIISVLISKFFPTVNIMTTSNHVHELANQANGLTEDELNHVSGRGRTEVNHS